jgi:hypothetical protein
MTTKVAFCIFHLKMKVIATSIKMRQITNINKGLKTLECSFFCIVLNIIPPLLLIRLNADKLQKILLSGVREVNDLQKNRPLPLSPICHQDCLKSPCFGYD